MNETLEAALYGLLVCAMFVGMWRCMRGSKSESGTDSSFSSDGNGDY